MPSATHDHPRFGSVGADGYYRLSRFDPSEAPEVDIAIETVDGKEGDLLRVRQAEAIVAILRWVAAERSRRQENRNEEGRSEKGAA